MAEERIPDMLRTVGGKLEASAGKALTDTSNQVGGLVEQAASTLEGAYGKTKDAAVEGVEAVKGAAIEGHDFLRKFMEENPHTTTVIALGIGLLIGYAAHTQPSRRRWWD